MSNILTLNQQFNTLVLNSTSTKLMFPITSFQIISRSVQGPRGPSGTLGEDGLSAYEIAVENGFIGTEQQWLDSLQATSLVSSVNTQTGDVIISKSDIGLSNVDNTADTNKPISTATQTALNSKAPLSHNHSIAEISNLQTSLDSKQPVSAVLTNTTASFTTSDETKLDSIESGAQANNVFIQDTSPVTSLDKYMWIDTSGGDLTIWIEDGV